MGNDVIGEEGGAGSTPAPGEELLRPFILPFCLLFDEMFCFGNHDTLINLKSSWFDFCLLKVFFFFFFFSASMDLNRGCKARNSTVHTGAKKHTLS